MGNTVNLNERQVSLLREAFQKTVQAFGTEVVYKVFDYVESEQDPVYGGRKEKTLQYKTSHKVSAYVEMNPKEWKLSAKGKAVGVDVIFVIPEKTLEDLSVVPESGRDKIEYEGVEYTIVDIDMGQKYFGDKAMALKFMCYEGTKEIR